ncbi:MAG: tRNA lysidine(34) synthetase TilS [Lentisphaerae bacterium]|nr:tRNA lysidine(34) synthetase TilS [Lentisphaerota bacterium]
MSERVLEYCRERHLLEGLRGLRVGFSGGADSTALLLILASSGLEIEAVHLHHGLRGEAADADQAWCERFCRARGVAFVSARLEVPCRRQAGESLEAAGRRLRLAYWQATTPAGSAVALGHHHDDCLEDLLLRLARGAHSGGLTAMRPRVEIGGVRLVRPLLEVRRAAIEEFLRARGIADWRCDHSNADTRLRRNAVRHEWLPALRATVGHDDGLGRSLEALRDDADCLASLAGSALRAVGSPAALRHLHPALLPRVLRLWLQQQTGQDWVVSRDTLLRLRQEVAAFDGRPRQITLGRGRLLQLDGGGLRLIPAASAVLPRRWEWGRDPMLELSEVGLRLEAAVVPGAVVAASAGEARRRPLRSGRWPTSWRSAPGSQAIGWCLSAGRRRRSCRTSSGRRGCRAGGAGAVRWW